MRNIVCLWLLLSSGCAYAALDSLPPLRIPVRATFAVADHLSNYYVITNTDALEKYAPDGRFLTRYGTPRLGAAAQVDVANPLRILVWYADAQTLVFLDRNLTEQGILRLLDVDFWQVSGVAQASDGNIWLYDAAQFRLYKIRPNGERLYESQALNQSQNIGPSATCLLEWEEKVWLYSPESGLLSFDLFGQWLNTAPLNGPLDIIATPNGCGLVPRGTARLVIGPDAVEVVRN